MFSLLLLPSTVADDLLELSKRGAKFVEAGFNSADDVFAVVAEGGDTVGTEAVAAPATDGWTSLGTGHIITMLVYF